MSATLTTDVEALLALVRAGLWGTPAPQSLYEGMDGAAWQRMYRMAAGQALIAVCFDGMATLPPDLRPPRTLYLQWAAMTAQVETANTRLDEVLHEVVARYRAEGVHPVVLKGQSMAALYPNPLHRQCGDIDLFVGKKGEPVANRLLRREGAVVEGEASDKHASYCYRHVHIENHRLIYRLNNPVANLRFRRMVYAWYPAAADERKGMPVPPPQFDALFIFLHAFGHFLNSGIGLRQLCDWARLMTQCRDRIDGVLLEQQLKQLGVLKAAKAFAHLAVHRLGMPAEACPFSTEGSERLADVLLEEIVQTGNFGQHDRRIRPRPKGYWSGKWYTFCRATRRCRVLAAFSRGEALCYPLILIKGTVAIQLNRLKPQP